jgi:D-glycero-alpha-D-manno-heptose-7-phosphate kinase
MDRGLEIHHDGDLPGRSGMGSSSAFTVGLLHALYALKGQMTGKEQLARESIHIEQNILKETVGSQDQVCAAYGGVNQIHFHPNGDVSVRPITLSHERMRELNQHLMLFYTGIKRTASDVASSYVGGLEARESQMKMLNSFVEQSAGILNGNGNLVELGELLHESWMAKRSLSHKVSNADVDQLYNDARAAGASGGKLLGAGGGGFVLLLVPPKQHDEVRSRLNRLIQVPFEFEFSGSQIIFFDLEKDYSAQEKTRAGQLIESFRELHQQVES